MKGRPAKLLAAGDIERAVMAAGDGRHRLRNQVMILLSVKAGLRAGEIAALTWDMVTDARGSIGPVIELPAVAAKKGSGRRIPAPSRPWGGLGPAPASGLGCRAGHHLRARRPDDRLVDCQLVREVLPGAWASRLLVPFRPPNLCHQGGPIGQPGRGLAPGCPGTRRPSVDQNHPGLH